MKRKIQIVIGVLCIYSSLVFLDYYCFLLREGFAMDKKIKEDNGVLLQPIGWVSSPIKSLQDAPKQGNEGAPDAWLEIKPEYLEALEGLKIGKEIIVLTWLHLGRRDLLKVHPRGNPANPLHGVFATRSPNRPNPIGLHQVELLAIDKKKGLKVRPLECLDRTPILDIKPVLDK
jgi:tRNA-Thr(GGU) m(6)t(6)A37 methyltransferase TsaA